MGFFDDLKMILDVTIIIVPIIIAIVLIFKFVVPRHPKIGIGMAIGGGLLGAFLVQRRLKNAFDVESKIAKHNQMMDEFKKKQKGRFEAVMANNEVIKTLEKQREILKKNEARHETEIRLIDAELQDRRELNKRIIEDADAFVKASKARSAERLGLLSQLEAEAGAPVAVSGGIIEIQGFRLLEV